MSISNSSGITLDSATEFAAFDRLPKEVRQAIANSPYKFCAHAIKKRGLSKQEMLDGIERAIAKRQLNGSSP